MWSASARPSRMRRATRRVSTRVLPDPAPATMQSAGDVGRDSLARWCSVSPASARVEGSDVARTAGRTRAPRLRVAPRELRLSVGCAGAEVVRRRSPVRRAPGGRDPDACWPSTAGGAPTATSAASSGRWSPGRCPSAVGPDLFGFGATPPPPEPWGTEEYARQLLPLFDDRRSAGRPDRARRSLVRRRVAVRLHGLVPDRIERLVLPGCRCSTGPGPTRPPRRRLPRRSAGSTGWGWSATSGWRWRAGSATGPPTTGPPRASCGRCSCRVLAEQYADVLAVHRLPGGPGVGRGRHRGAARGGGAGRPIFPAARLTCCPGSATSPRSRHREACAAWSTGRSGRSAGDQPAVVADPIRGLVTDGGSSPARVLGPARFQPAWPGSRWPAVWRPASPPGSAGCGWPSGSTTWPDRCCGSPCRWWRIVPLQRGPWPSSRSVAAVVSSGGRSPAWPRPRSWPSARSAYRLRGRTSPLAWTRRLRTLAAVVGGCSRWSWWSSAA